nr:hypothetical protein [Tanacetum cinerariifolium]
MANLTDMLSKIVSSNTASSSRSGTLPGNTITNPKEDLKGVTTRSGVAYPGPKTPTPSKQGTKVTKDRAQTSSSQNTAPVQPSVIQPKPQASVSEPVVASVSAPLPNVKPFIPYPLRRDDEKLALPPLKMIQLFPLLLLPSLPSGIVIFFLRKAAIDDEPISPKIDESYYDSEGYIILLEEFLNDDQSSPPLPPQELKVVKPKNKKSSIDEP